MHMTFQRMILPTAVQVNQTKVVGMNLAYVHVRPDMNSWAKIDLVVGHPYL
jgi:hypothetical protein